MQPVVLVFDAQMGRCGACGICPVIEGWGGKAIYDVAVGRPRSQCVTVLDIPGQLRVHVSGSPGRACQPCQRASITPNRVKRLKRGGGRISGHRCQTIAIIVSTRSKRKARIGNWMWVNESELTLTSVKEWQMQLCPLGDRVVSWFIC